jgi:hypothetical protein
VGGDRIDLCKLRPSTGVAGCCNARIEESSRMTDSRIHAVMAAAIQNPELISRWEEHPSQLLEFGVDPDTVDLSSLRKFSGLAIKVRHNALRAALPCTFRLMSIAEMDIELFAAYAVHLSVRGESIANTDARRAEMLVKFFGECLNRRQPVRQLLWDVIRHEHAMMYLRDAPPPIAQPRDTTPRICGTLLLHDMRCDPREADFTLRQPAPDLEEIDTSERFFGYWRADATSGTAIVELDEYAYYTLSFADGRSLEDLSAALTGKRRPTRTFLRALDQLRHAGLLDFEPAAAVEA